MKRRVLYLLEVDAPINVFYNRRCYGRGAAHKMLRLAREFYGRGNVRLDVYVRKHHKRYYYSYE